MAATHPNSFFLITKSVSTKKKEKKNMPSSGIHPLTHTHSSQQLPAYEPEQHPSAPLPCYVAEPPSAPIFDPALTLYFTNDNLESPIPFDRNVHTCASPESPPFLSLIFDETLSNPEQLGNSTQITRRSKTLEC